MVKSQHRNGVNGMKNHIEIGEKNVTVYFDGQGHTFDDMDNMTLLLDTIPRNTVFTIESVDTTLTQQLAVSAVISSFKRRFNFANVIQCL